MTLPAHGWRQPAILSVPDWSVVAPPQVEGGQMRAAAEEEVQPVQTMAEAVQLVQRTVAAVVAEVLARKMEGVEAAEAGPMRTEVEVVPAHRAAVAD